MHTTLQWIKQNGSQLSKRHSLESALLAMSLYPSLFQHVQVPSFIPVPLCAIKSRSKGRSRKDPQYPSSAMFVLFLVVHLDQKIVFLFSAALIKLPSIIFLLS